MRKLLLTLVGVIFCAVNTFAVTEDIFNGALPDGWVKMSGTVAKATRANVSCLQLQKVTSIVSPKYSNLSKLTLNLTISSGATTLTVAYASDANSTTWNMLKTVAKADCSTSEWRDFEIDMSNVDSSNGIYIKLTSAASSFYISKLTYEVSGSTPELKIVETPKINPDGGSVEAGSTITFVCATEGVTYHYAWNGGAETTGDSTTAQAGKLTVYATKDGMKQSESATATFTISSTVIETVATPTITPNGGEVEAGSTITFACATDGVIYHYAWNGGAETTGASTPAQAGTLNVYATKDGMNQSALATADFTIKSQGGDVDGWKLVTSASELEVGARYIIVAKNSSKYMGMGNVAADNQRNAVQITVSNNVVSNDEVTSKALMTFKLGQGTTGTYTWIAENYLGEGEYLNPKTGNTDLPLSASPVSTYVTFDGNLVAIKGSSDTKRAVLYGNSTSIFKSYSYSTAYTYPSLYKWTGKEVVVAPTTVTFTPETGKEFTIGSEAVVTVKADVDCKLYYSLDGVATAESTEYDAATGIVLATDEIGKEYNVSVFAENEAGNCNGSATYTIVDKKHVAPTAIVIKENEGNYEAGAELTVSLAADTKAYPAPELFYTIDGRAANDGNATPYTQPFTVVERGEGHKTVTVNAYAVNDAGDCVASAMYIFGANKVDAGDPDKWSLVTNVAQLNDGDEVLIVSPQYKKALSNVQNTNNRRVVDVEFEDETYSEIKSIEDNAQLITLNNTEKGWTLKTDNYQDKNGNTFESGYLYATGSSYLHTESEIQDKENASSYAKISVKSNGIAEIDFAVTALKTAEYMAFNNANGGLWSCYVGPYGDPDYAEHTSQYDAPHFYKKGGFRYEAVEEFYLVMPVNEYTGKHEVYPFVYKGEENGEHLYEVSVSYIGGEFYVRDGRADNSGTYFGSSVEQDARTASALRANAANDMVPIVSEKTEYALVHKPAADTHTMFTTHVSEENNAIENATFTMVYTPGSHADGKLRVKALVPTGIENVGADVEGAVEYFNLQGIRISEPAKGQVVIRRQGNRVEKIAVR